jgi:uncharacterized hydrophobic protein (TIGR00271 family)|tara:strand:- start:66 stop:1511 length:1446 start_codon:yes stop_codon:yes gene_type:complete
MKEDTTNELEQNKEEVRQDAKGLLKSLKAFFIELLDFRADTDRDATIEAIKNDVPFKGATAWILICSIFVASIGLNANSTAVVIGAMLISPLMGPILGIGMSIAINDIFTLRKSLINFGVMVILSVFTAFMFFWFFPLREESSELLARTQPDIRDVLIAFFGGLALIIARTKKGTIASVIFGVAIATALMPPLCTVGYGLSEALIGNPNGLAFAGGAMYLFIINTIFIAIATFLVLKVLRFPMIRYVNSLKRKNTARFASLVALLVMVFPAYTFYKVYKESTFENSAKQFIENELSALPNANYIKKYAAYQFNPGGISTIELTSFGADQVEEMTMNFLKKRMLTYSDLREVNLLLNQSSKDNSYKDEVKYIAELRFRDSLDLMSKNQKIIFLEEKLAKLSVLEADQIPFESIAEEARINYDGLKSLSFSIKLVSDFNNIDTLTVFTVQWKDSLSPTKVSADKKRLYEWLKFKVPADSLVLD